MLFGEEDGFTLNDLGRRLANIIRIGIIFEINYEEAKARVKIGNLETDFLPWINSNSQGSKSWNPPEIDEQVVILSPDGELSGGVILSSLYKNNAPESNKDIKSIIFKDGSKISFNQDSGNLHLDLKGNATIKVAGNAKIEGANATIKANSAKIEASTVEAIGSSITLKGSNINLGGSGGQPVARVGDKVAIASGSSAGQWPIVSGSSKVKAA